MRRWAVDGVGGGPCLWMGGWAVRWAVALDGSCSG